MSRAELATLLGERERVSEETTSLMDEGERRLEEALLDYLRLNKVRVSAKNKRPERNAPIEAWNDYQRPRALDKLSGWEVALIKLPLTAHYVPRYDELQQRRRWLRHEIARLGPQLRPEASDTWLELHRTHPHHTQGYGADSYGENEAKVWASEREGLGIELRVRKVVVGEQKTDRWGCPSGSRHWLVEGLVRDHVDVEIVKHHHADLRTWLAACWKRGVNPRVLNPYLPYGLEQKLGIDYFGNIKGA